MIALTCPHACKGNWFIENSRHVRWNLVKGTAIGSLELRAPVITLEKRVPTEVLVILYQDKSQ